MLHAEGARIEADSRLERYLQPGPSCLPAELPRGQDHRHRELEATTLDGVGPLQRTLHTTLPALRNTIIFVLSVTVNLFTEPPIDWGAILACAVLTTLPVVIGFWFFLRHLARPDARVGLR